ncbi:formyltransferase family protein [Microvirga makkahensis]|uniref:Methionyl-tRNA formyltransferase n=1 Tax=Microvirga makkahensis TaxID=1128670 RepID=A0A7X3MTD3_9HYPH|nr:formyltransferase family protein [Microvirga makkahensis]MXQ12893.1 methionyl-tRNA formyltransferase [Microvirga makkahensis]
MKITVFTSNNPRHLRLAERLASIADTVFMVQECMTVFPGTVDDFYKRSEVMQDYFTRVIAAEREVFGIPRFLPPNVRQLALRTGDLSLAPLEMLRPALESDLYVVLGASYIRPPLVDFLIEKRTINIHMGISPYYRGSSCNFWALYDGNPDMVGATIHMLSKGLDSGPMLYHVRPPIEPVDPFVFGMKAVDAAQKSLVARIASREIFEFPPVVQDRSQEIRYTRNRDFTDEVAAEYLRRAPSADQLFDALKAQPDRDFLRLYQPES